MALPSAPCEGSAHGLLRAHVAQAHLGGAQHALGHGRAPSAGFAPELGGTPPPELSGPVPPLELPAELPALGGAAGSQPPVPGPSTVTSSASWQGDSEDGGRAGLGAGRGAAASDPDDAEPGDADPAAAAAGGAAANVSSGGNEGALG